MLQMGGWLSAALALPEWELLAAALQKTPPDGAAPAKPLQLHPNDLADVEAITSHIIPTDTTLGAKEAGVTQFIEHALGSFLAAVAGDFRAGLAEFQRGVRARYPDSASFASLGEVRQVEWLRSVEHSAEHPGFFMLMRELTVLGMFSNPSYGGNRNGVGWQLLGFRDEHAYAPPFGYYDRDYPGFHPDGGNGS
jgi:gluconate 2-dehydrogenase gamma chain